MLTWKYLRERRLNKLFSKYLVSIWNKPTVSGLILNRFAVCETEMGKELRSCPAGP
jgi:hypothetical protein